MTAVRQTSRATFDITDFGASALAADNSTAVQRAINAAYAAGGGTVHVPAGVFRCDSQITLPFDHDDGQVPILIKGCADPTSSFWDPAGATTAGSVLDLRYNGTLGKLVSLGVGVFGLEGITLACFSAAADDIPLVYSTLAQPRFRNVTFSGNDATTGGACVQDAIVLGGTGTTKPEGGTTSAFSGYGGFVHNCSFVRTRKAILMQNRVNNAVFAENWIDLSCGSAETNSAPIVIDPGGSTASYYAWGNVIRDNTIEIINYDYGIKLVQNAKYNVIRGNGFWDADGTELGAIWLDPATCRDNFILLDGYVTNDNITGASGGAYAGAGHNWVEMQNAQFCSWTSEYKPAGWKMYLNGSTNGSQSIAYDAGPDGPLLTGYGGVGVRSSASAKQFTIRASNGTPEAAVAAPVGDLCCDVTNGKLYIKTSGSGNTGWTVVGTQT